MMSDTPTYHGLFPVLVMESYHNDPASIKTAISQNILNHVDETGLSGEASGNIALHLDPAFGELFEFAIASVKNFISGYKLDPSIFDYTIVKSWANVLYNCSTPYHHHRDAHVSFCYYVNVPSNQNMAITFYDREDKHEPFAQITRCNPVSTFTPFNSPSWYFNIKEGQIMVFPSSVPHGVNCNLKEEDEVPTMKTPDDFYRYRISIAGDVLLTHKNKTTNPLGLQPMTQWRTYK
jgi:hypothetical protein